jgi:hypothetical protein
MPRRRQHRRSLFQSVAKNIFLISALVTALGVIAGAWITAGFPIPAWSTDIKRLDARQTDTAIDLYSKALDDAIIRQDLLKDPSVRALNAKKIEQTTKTLDQLRMRKLEMTK